MKQVVENSSIMQWWTRRPLRIKYIETTFPIFHSQPVLLFLYNIILYVARSFLRKKSWKIKGQSENRRWNDYAIQWLMEKKTKMIYRITPFIVLNRYLLLIDRCRSRHEAVPYYFKLNAIIIITNYIVKGHNNYHSGKWNE